jgi:hypothetical protein
LEVRGWRIEAKYLKIRRSEERPTAVGGALRFRLEARDLNLRR